MRIGGYVLLRTVVMSAEHQHRNPRCANGHLIHKDLSGKPRHMQRYHYESQIARKCRLIDEDKSFCNTCGTYHALVHRFKSRFLSVCLKWIVIHQ